MANQPTMNNPQRALQVWSLLALAAMTRTVLTYEEVANLTGLANTCGNVLGYIYYYCAHHNLPLLPSLVVDKHTGKPAVKAGALYNNERITAEHRRCFEYDWMKHGAPSIEELQDANETRKGDAIASPSPAPAPLCL
jgi:hypothetical protein